jgi:hypothetical protein
MNQGTNQNLLSASVTLSDDIDELFFVVQALQYLFGIAKISCYPKNGSNT